MELTELKFAVNTEELSTAVKKLEALGVAISDYNKVNGDKARADRESAAAAKALAKEQKAQEQATKKATEAAEKAAAAQKKNASAAADAAEEMAPLEKLLNKLNNQYGDLVAGFTKGEASILQQARNFGAAENELKPFIGVLEKIKELTKDPFDASVGAIRSVTAEFDRLTQRSNLTAQGISLTTKQLSEYSRLSAEVSGKVNQLGLDPTQGAGLAKYNTMLAESQAEYLKIAGSVNRLTEEEKQRNAVLREQEKLAAQNLRLQQKALEENATAMNQAVAEFRRLEQAKAAAAQSTADKIIKANADAVASAQRLNQITAMVQQGISEKEATKRVGMASQGISAENINQIIAAEKNLAATRTTGTRSVTSYDAAARELAKAQKWVTTEEEKMISVLATLNQQHDNSAAFNEKAARSVFNYEQALKKSGITGEQAAAKLAVYRKQQQEILSVEQKRQAEYLKRGLQPQIGDVVVSLAAGQNPLTVLLQQGDQVRGLIAQTGIQGELLRKTMQSAMADTLKSVVQTATAMGSLFAGAAVSAGKSITGLVTGPIAALVTGFNESTAAGNSAFEAIGTAFSRAFSATSTAALTALPIFLTTAAAGLIAFGVAAYQVMKEQTALSIALNTTGGALAMTRDQALSFVEANKSANTTTTKGIEVLTAMAKAGNLSAETYGMISESAIAMEKYAGISIEKTVESFNKMREKPVESLTELAKATGLVSPAILEVVASLMKQGREAEAVNIAMIALATVNREQAANMAKDLSPIEKLWKDITANIYAAWDAIKGAVASVTLVGIMRSAWEKIAIIVSTVWYVIKQTGNEIGGIISQFSALGEGGGIFSSEGRAAWTRVGEVMKTDAEAARKAQDELVASILRTGSAQETQATATARTREELLQSVAYAQQFEERQKLINEQEKIRAGLDQKKLTRAEAMQKAEEDALKRVKNLTSAEIARIRETAGLQWDKSRASDQTKAQNDLNKSKELAIDILNREVGLTSTYNNDLARLYKAKKDLNWTDEYYGKLVEDLIKQQPFYTKQQKEQKDAIDRTTKAQETYNDILGVSSGFNTDYNNKLEQLNYLRDSGIKSLTEYETALDALNKKQPYYLKQLADEEKVRKAIADALKKQQDELKKLTEETDKYAHSLQKAYEEVLLEKELMGLSAEDRARRLETLKVEQKYLEEVEAAQRAYNISFSDYMDLLDKAKANRELGLRIIDEKANIDALKRIEKLSSSIVDALFIGGEAGAKSLRDSLVSELKKPVTVLVNAFINPIMQNLSATIRNGMQGGASSSGIMGSLSSMSSIGQLAQLANQGYASALGTGVSALFGTTAGNSAIATAITGSASSATAAASAAAQAAGATSAAAGTMASLGASIATAVPWVAAALFAVNILDSGLSRGPIENRAQGIQGTFSNNQFQGQSFQDKFQRGASGLFGMSFLGGSSNKNWTETQDLADDTIKAFSKGFSSLKNSAESFAKSLGLSAEKLTTFSTDIKIALTADAEKNKEIIAKMFADVADIVATTLAPTLKYFAKDGETAAVTFQRLSETILTVNLVLKDLGAALFKTSLDGANAAQALVDSAGGIQQFGQISAAYYNSIYSADQKLANSARKLKEGFVELGIAIPTDKLAYQVLVQQAVATGANDTAVKLMLLAPLFDELSKTSEEAGKSFSDLGKSIVDWIKTLLNETSTSGNNLLAAKSAYLRDLELAQTNDKTALSSITGSAKSYLDIAKASSTSFAAYRLMTAKVVSDLQALPAINALNATADTPTIAAMNTQIDIQQKQLDTLVEIKAIQTKAAGDEVVRLAAEKEKQKAALEALNRQRAIDEDYAKYILYRGAESPNALGNAFTSSGIYSTPTFFSSANGEPQVMGEAGPEAVMPLSRMSDGSLGIRALQFSQGNSTDSSAVLQVLIQLNANIEGLRSEVRADVTHNAKTARLLDRVIPDGDSVAVKVVV